MCKVVGVSMQQQLAGNAGRCSDGSAETTAWLNGSESVFKPSGGSSAHRRRRRQDKVHKRRRNGRREELKVPAAAHSTDILPAFLQGAGRAQAGCWLPGSSPGGGGCGRAVGVASRRVQVRQHKGRRERSGACVFQRPSAA